MPRLKRQKNKHKPDLNSSKSCYFRILRLASIKERNTKELKERLIDKEGFTSSAYREAIDKAIDLGIVDDMRYAEFYCRHKIAAKRGTAGIEEQLAKLEIDYSDSEIINSILANAKINEEQTAFEFLVTHPPRSKNKYSSAAAKLIRRGFAPEIAFKTSSR